MNNLYETSLIQNKATIVALDDVKKAVDTVIAVLAKFEGKVVNVRLERDVNEALVALGIPCNVALKKDAIGGVFKELIINANNRSIEYQGRDIYTQVYSCGVSLKLENKRLVSWSDVATVMESIDALTTDHSFTEQQYERMAEQIQSLAEQISEVLSPLSERNRNVLSYKLRSSLPYNVVRFIKKG